MREQYKDILKNFFHSKILNTRHQLSLSQEDMACRLSMSCRNYFDLDHGNSCCSAVTLALYLIYLCDDPIIFLDELRYAFETVLVLDQ